MSNSAFIRSYIKDLAAAERIVKPGIKKAIGLMRDYVLARVSEGKDIGSLRDFLFMRTDLANVLTEGMAYAHMLGDNRVRSHFAKREIKFDLKATILGTFRDANVATLEYLKHRYDSKAFDIIEGIGEYADKVLRDTLASAINKGLPIKGIIGEMRLSLNKLGLSETNARTVETIARTQTQLAFNAGKYNAEQDPDIAEVLWGYTYVTVGDDRVRPEHELIDNVTLPKDHAFWDTNYPPNGWNCRCQVIPLFDRERQVKPPAEYEGPDKDFNFNPGNAFSGIS